MKIVIANKSHSIYASAICQAIEDAAKVRGTGIARRQPEYIISKIEKAQAVIALDKNKFAGFCYIESWGHGKFVANSGLIVHPDYRGQGLAKRIKHKIFEHSRKQFPEAKVFSITTGLAVMKLNSDLGYKPVTFSELTDDQEFWKGCQTCKNYDVLQRTNQSMCLCTGMLFDPKVKISKKKKIKEKVVNRLQRIKRNLLLRNTKIKLL
ncbi:MAG: GNAT family N-acetyltransferase [Flavobacteriaceae bacterium]|nr:GNAT family N-acetyltransferase [Bacteroidia bacterium]MBT8286570.1 GNAT family N-acetyltransferase [Bacteroidia bacterium]NNF75473.1 GNAT family N-acetyltransferase [Flavobacteriaceae bacterium]NNK74037.1 GNAT family N-acetyltransferase [Flavobacteriaceae bacterium]